MGPVHVELKADEGVGVGEFLVASEIVEAPGGAAVGSLSLPDGTPDRRRRGAGRPSAACPSATSSSATPT